MLTTMFGDWDTCEEGEDLMEKKVGHLEKIEALLGQQIEEFEYRLGHEANKVLGV